MGNTGAMRGAPSTRAIGNSGGAKCQCVRYQGTYTASVPGAMTRKIAEPMIAAARCTIGAYPTPPDWASARVAFNFSDDRELRTSDVLDLRRVGAAKVRLRRLTPALSGPRSCVRCSAWLGVMPHDALN